MANEIRLRRNNMAGTITDNPLPMVSTTINSPGFVDLPVVDGTNHLILVLDPLEVLGAAEIVMVTAHTAAASVVTVTRGVEGSAPRAHNLGTTWFHGPVASDWALSDVTSSTRPTVPYEGELIYETDTNRLAVHDGGVWQPGSIVSIATSGARPPTPFQGQLIYETDTDKYVGRDAGSVWQDVVPLGAWTTYVPSHANITVGNGVQTAAFIRIGRMITVRWRLVFGTTTSVGASNVALGLPAAAVTGLEQTLPAHYLDSGTANYIGVGAVGRQSTSLASLLHAVPGSGAGAVSTTAPFTWTTNDTMNITGTYEAAS